jgi:hypothetical protein
LSLARALQLLVTVAFALGQFLVQFRLDQN